MMTPRPGTTGNQTSPTSKPRILLVSVTKNALPWVPVEADKSMDVATEDRVIEKKAVREETTHRAHLIRYEMHKPVVLHYIHHLQCISEPKPVFNSARKPKTAETIQFDRKEPREIDMEQASACHELTIEQMKVAMITTRQIKKEDIGRTIDTVRTEVITFVEKPPLYILIDEDDDEDDDLL